MNRPEYPEMIHTYDGWGVIARGHGLTTEQQADAIRECDPAMLPQANQMIVAQEEHFGFAPRVKWCGERYGSSCDQEGDWHGHWYALKANDDESTKFTIMHLKDVPAVKAKSLPDPLADMLNDPEGRALVQAIHDRKAQA